MPKLDDRDSLIANNPQVLLVSGGTGFFGKALLRFWLSPKGKALRPSSAIILSRSPDRFLQAYPEFLDENWITWITADLTNPKSMFGIEVGGVSHVLHAATESTLGSTLTYQKQFDQILDGTRNMLALALRAGRPRFLLTSSGGVYGNFPPGHSQVCESYLGIPNPLAPRSAYSIGKRASEHLCALAANEHGLPIVISRPFAFCGPDLPLNVHFAIGNFIRDALYADKITVSGDGSPVRSYLDQDDLAAWLTSLLSDGQPGEAYNVGSDEPISILDLAYLVRDLIAPNKRVEVLKAFDEIADRQYYVPNISKITKALGVRQTVSLEKSIVRTAYAIGNPDLKPQVST
jgi:UDP-glucuronate decarboxylase